jgi:hypothetical protein
MANEVTVRIKVIDRNDSPISGYPVLIMNPDTDAHPFAPSPTSVVASGDTDMNGSYAFTGIAAGTYDIKLVDPSGNSIYNYNYIVKNSYVVDPANVFENRFAVRSGEHIQGVGPGILARSSDAIGGMYSSYTFTKNPVVGTASGTGRRPDGNLIDGTGNTHFQNAVNGDILTLGQSILQKASGNAYYHDNQNLSFTQTLEIVVGA